MKNKIKQRGFTLIEIVIALAMFSVLTMSFYFVMANIYTNSKIEFFITKKIFASVENLERAATMVSDLEIESGDKMSLALKNEIEERVLNKHGDVKYIDTFEIFASQGYKSKVDAYFISREINVGDTLNNEESILTSEQERLLPRGTNQNDYYIYIVANDKKKEVRIPEYEYVKILKKKNSSDINDQGYAFDYAYFENIKNGKTLLGAYKIDDKTKDLLFFEKYNWEFSKRKNKDGIFFLPHNRLRSAHPTTAEEISASSKGDNYRNGAEILIDVEDMALSYPFGSFYYNDMNRKKIFFKSDKPLPHDGYLRFTLEPVAKSMVKLSSIKSNAIWVIALPTTNRLLYHFDVSLAKAADTKIVAGRIEQKANNLRDLSTSLYNEDTDKRFFEPIVLNSEIPVYTDNSAYGRYIKLSASDDLIFKEPRLLSGENDSLNYILFVVIDTSEASPGTFFKQLDPSKNNALSISYDGANVFSLDSFYGTDKRFNKHKGSDRNLHILMLRSIDDRSGTVVYQMAVDILNSPSAAKLIASKKSKLNSPLVLGGASGLRVKEILAFKTDFDPSHTTLLKMAPVYDYLLRKYIN